MSLFVARISANSPKTISGRGASGARTRARLFVPAGQASRRRLAEGAQMDQSTSSLRGRKRGARNPTDASRTHCPGGLQSRLHRSIPVVASRTVIASVFDMRPPGRLWPADRRPSWEAPPWRRGCLPEGRNGRKDRSRPGEIPRAAGPTNEAPATCPAVRRVGGAREASPPHVPTSWRPGRRAYRGPAVRASSPRSSRRRVRAS